MFVYFYSIRKCDHRNYCFLDAIEREQRKQTLCLAYTGIGPPVSFFSTGNDTVESVVGKYKKIENTITDSSTLI